VPDIMLFSGSSSTVLAKKVAERLGISLGKAKIGRFSDGETMVEILENVRGREIFVMQSTSAPANDHLMELVFIVDALRRASAKRISVILPYFGYARQDRRVRSARVPISAKVVADMLAAVGVHRILTVDLHADQIQGFFRMPVDNIYGSGTMADDIIQHSHDEVMIASPDVGGVVRARAVAKRIGAELVIIDKRRLAPNEAQVMHIIGKVKGKHCIIVDDIVDTAGTLCKAVEALLEDGAKKVSAYTTHAVLSGNAISTISHSSLEELVVMDTIPLSKAAEICPKIRQIDLSDLLARAIHRICSSKSVSSMFSDETH
jgi:ribose-phosphate pyrophosphokinase